MADDNPENQDCAEDEVEETALESLKNLIEEMRNAKKYFNLNNCAEGILLKVFLPANDIISDFLVAENLLRVKNDTQTISTWFTFFAYYFIACPGIMFIFTIIGKRFRGFLLPFIFMFCFFCLEAILIHHSYAKLLFPLAVTVASLTLFLGVLDIFFHGPRMKKISYLVAGFEGRYESAPEFLMHLTLLISGERYFYDSGLNFYGLCTSLVMLGKDLTENILIDEKFLQKSLMEKLEAMRRIILAVIFTAIFRLGTLALAIHHIFVLDQGLYLIPLKLIIMIVPVIFIFCAQRHYETSQRITVPECFVGIIGELSSFYNWSVWSENFKKRIQFVLNVYYNLIYGGYCIWTIWNPLNEQAGTFAVVCLCSGWVAFPLYVSQILMSKKNEDDQEVQEESNDYQHHDVITYM